jgi:inhibitor of cysteine peptidase
MTTEYTGQNDEITARVGEEFTVALESNPTTGYGWEAHYDSAILQLIDRWFSPSGPGIGSGGIERFRFKCLAVGESRLRLMYKRPWEKISAEDIVFQVHVKN